MMRHSREVAFGRIRSQCDQMTQPGKVASREVAFGRTPLKGCDNATACDLGSVAPGGRALRKGPKPADVPGNFGRAALAAAAGAA